MRRPPFLLAAVLVAALFFSACAGKSAKPLVIGSKNFTEQTILLEIVAQHLESRLGIKTDRRPYLGGTLVAHQAVAAAQIDLYVEYTGTALAAVLHEEPPKDAAAARARVRARYAEKFGLWVGEPLGFDNTFVIVVRGEDAQRYNLRAVSDLMRVPHKWRAGFGYEFKERADGYDGFVKSYSLRFAEAPRFMELGLLYRALQEKQVDVVAGSATDGVIAALGMVALQDDLHYFPPYEAVPVVNASAGERFPGLRDALNGLAGKISAEEMRRMNYAVDGEKRDAAAVAREFLAVKHLLP